ncbi:MAG: hypothetical protein H6Q51_1634, partial [Deltaproteobacteria bacterium]|nr:hypothetical protein [Deltaproteobacteria bacterium]
MVGEGKGGQAKTFGSFEELGQADSAVEQAIDRVDVQMDKVSLTHGYKTLSLLPLDSARRLRGDIVDDPVDSRHLVDDSAGH